MSEEIRIGVFICDCGSNIAGVVRVPEVVEYARGLPHVAFADEGKWSCSVDALGSMQRSIKDQNLNRVVIASCTPRTHEPLFKQTVREAGLNPYLLEFVSIREQVSWVHMNEPDAATQKAKDLVKMGVAKAALLEKGEEIRLPVGKECMIIGGGVAGMNTALHVARQGFQALLVEKQPELGGLLNRITTISHEHGEAVAEEIVKRMKGLVAAEPNIRVFTQAEIEEVKGYIGNYKVKLRSNGTSENLDVSTIVVATGMREIRPEGQYFYGSDPRVVTQLELEAFLKIGQIDQPKKTVIINCVGSKNETKGCCSIGCPVSVKNAFTLKNLNKDSLVHVLYRDLSMVKEEHFQLDAAKAAGVKFIRFPDDRYPEVVNEDGKLKVKVCDILSGKDFILPADLLVLTVGFEGDETMEALKGHLKVSSNAEGFFQERHIKLGPLDFPADGIALCGCAKNPKTFKESCEEGIGAAMRVSIPMKNGHIEAEGIVADIDLTDCNACGLCSKRCPYGAIQVNEQKQPSVVKALCKGCGLCAADCPKECIAIVHYSDDQLQAQVDAALEENAEKKILGFVCHWCALGGVDMAGVSRLQYPTNARLIRVMCSARVPIKLIERAFEKGAAGVLVAGCEFPTCHYITGNYACETRIKRAKKVISKKGYDPEKLWNVWCSAADGPKFANTMREMVKKLDLGK
ncbi:MAG: 4Fe-4S ferredoxin [Deltaproteobacteria bacterium HGW-Deltaproteobacteria-15]|jgi:heterodisulfide reductase subunit A|nr:MAG: 4Fe-4S ferredoxin [Deltaproteobacteria bacterium HGW-Deltaproteobacteria-15]